MWFANIDTRYPLRSIHTRPMTHLCHAAHSRVNFRIYVGPMEVDAGTAGVVGVRTHKLRSCRNTGSMLVQQQVIGELSPRSQFEHR